jgi:hypothetical protein
MDSSRVALSTMSTSTQSQRQKKRQQSFCSRDTEKAYVEGLEDGYRDGLQGDGVTVLTQATKKMGDNSKRDGQHY